MTSSDTNPICILSDDEDSDIEIIKEEKIDLDDGDVIFVSETTPTVSTKDKTTNKIADIISLQSGTSEQADDEMDIKPGGISCHRNLSISSGLEMALNLHDHSELSSPLDLSARKLGDDTESDDSLDSSCASTSFSSSDESSLLDLPDDTVVIKSESSVPCQKQTVVQKDQFTGDGDNDVITMQVADSSKSSARLFQSDCLNNYLTDSLTFFQSSCKPVQSSIHKSEPPKKSDCNNDTTASLSISPFANQVPHLSCSSPIGSLSLIMPHISSADTITSSSLTPHSPPQAINSSSLPDNQSPQCSVPKKRKESSPDIFDSADIWTSIRKDLDDLNDMIDSDPGDSKQQSLSNLSGATSNFTFKGNSTTSQVVDNLKSNLSSEINSVQKHDQSISYTIHQSSSTTTKPSDITSSESSMPSRWNSSSSLKQLPPKKQPRCFRTNSEHLGTNISNNSSSLTDSGMKWGSEKCSSCVISLFGLKSSRCLQGHVTCGSCLEEKVKLVLTGKSKESLRCVQANCDSYYPMTLLRTQGVHSLTEEENSAMSELKHSLPSMVVEILEDKLDNDYIDYIASMIMKNACPSTPDSGTHDKVTTVEQLSDTTLPPGAQVEETGAGLQPETSSGKDQNVEEWPSDWIAMDQRAGFVLVPLKPESPEYIDVAFKFHSSMTFPTADIIKISRVQNPILWKKHSVKRLEMIHDNDGLNVEERYLFHGTTLSVVDAICNKGFDWRVCGKHGTVYGQGSYFAVNASYSHQYTDKQGKRPRLLRLGSVAFRSRTTTTTGFLGSSQMPHLPSFPQPPLSLIPPPPAHAGTNLFTSFRSGPSSADLSSANLTAALLNFQAQGQVQGQGQNQSQGQVQSQGQGNTNNNMSASGNGPFQSNTGLIGAPQVQFNPTAPPSTMTQNGNSASTTPPSQNVSNFNFAGSLAPRKRCFFHRMLGTSSMTSGSQLNIQEEPSETKSEHKMFMSKVLVGKFTGGHANLRKPPPLFPDTDPYGKCYDSCVDNIMDPKIFVIFDSTQAYPEYMIEYNFTC